LSFGRLIAIQYLIKLIYLVCSEVLTAQLIRLEERGRQFKSRGVRYLFIPRLLGLNCSGWHNRRYNLLFNVVWSQFISHCYTM